MPIHAPVAGKADRGQRLGPGQADIGKAPLLLQPFHAGFVHAALAGEKTVLPSRQEDDGIFQPLRRVQRHDRDRVLRLVIVAIHDQGHMFQKALKVVEFLQRLDQFLEVFQPARRLGRFVVLPHGGIAGLVEDPLGQFDMVCVGVQGIGVEAAHRIGEFAQIGRALAAQKPVGHDRLRADQQRFGQIPRLLLDGLHRLVAKAALGRVDHALEGQIVAGRDRQPEIGHGVADFLPLIEARAADDPVRQADGQETVLESAHLVAGTDQNRHIVQIVAAQAAAGAGMEILDLLADPAGLGLAVPMPDQADLQAVLGIGPERLAQPALVRGNQPRGRAQDLRGGTIVLFQPDHLRARKILLEAQDIADLGPAPAIDRLVVIADAADIAMGLRQQPQPQILGDVGILIFVDEDIAEAVLPAGQNIGMGLKQRHAMQQQIAEIDRVQCQQTVLIGAVKLHALAIVGRALVAADLVRCQRPVLPAVDHPGQLPGGPPLFVDVFRRDQLLKQPQLVVGVQNGETGLQMQVARADQFGMAAQDLDRNAVKCAEPRHPLDRVAQQPANAVAHLARGLVGEGHGKNLPRKGPARRDQMRDSRRQRPRLAGAGPGQHQHRPIQRLDRPALRVVQPLQIGGRTGRHAHGALRQAELAFGGFEGIVIHHGRDNSAPLRSGKDGVHRMFGRGTSFGQSYSCIGRASLDLCRRKNINYQ